MRNILIGLVVLVLLVVAGALFWLQDANRLKPNFESLISEQAGMDIAIEGDLSWQLFPPIALTANQVTTDLDGDAVRIGSLTLNIEVMSLLRDQRSPGDWEIESVVISNTVVASGEDTIEIANLTMQQLKLGDEVPFSAELDYVAKDTPPLPVTAEGFITITADERLRLNRMDFTAGEYAGRCNAALVPAGGNYPAAPTTPDDLLPASLVRDYNGELDCNLADVDIDDETFADIGVAATIRAARVDADVKLPEFFGGSAGADVKIDTQVVPFAWTVQPNLTGVDSQRLMAWLGTPLAWIAPLAYGGAVEMRGNTEPALLSSIRGSTRFDGNQGTIDITQIKEPAVAIASLAGDASSVEGWPNPLDYRKLIGDWNIDGRQHTLDVQLDNLRMEAEGDVDLVGDSVDMLVYLTFEDDPELSSFDANENLVGIPLPMRCQGTLAEVSCATDEAATRKALARALTGDTELRRKLDEKIDEDVPEEYRDAARDLLDLLGEQDN